jgi:hypothetical protein
MQVYLFNVKFRTLLKPYIEKTSSLDSIFPFHPQERKREVLHCAMGLTSHWLHGNSIPKTGCHYFWPGLTALPKNTPTDWRVSHAAFVHNSTMK